MSRLIKNTAILFGVEATYGVDPVLSAVTQAMLVANLTVPDTAFTNVDRALIRPFLGGSEQLPGNRNVPFGFDVELVGSGTLGTRPPMADVLLASGMAETVLAGTRVDYSPITSMLSSASCYWHDDGAKSLLLGARGNCTFKMNAGERPLIMFAGIALDGGLSATANPAVTLTAFKTPEAVTEANSLDIVLGCTSLATGAPALTGGTTFPSLGIEFNLGNKVQHSAILGGESIDILDRISVGTIKLDVTAAQEVANYNTVKGATLTSVGFVHGTVGGKKVQVFLPFCQLINPKKIDFNGKRMVQYELRILPSLGNDEVRLTFF
jgi:hypothetical protein